VCRWVVEDGWWEAGVGRCVVGFWVLGEAGGGGGLSGVSGGEFILVCGCWFGWGVGWVGWYWVGVGGFVGLRWDWGCCLVVFSRWFVLGCGVGVW